MDIITDINALDSIPDLLPGSLIGGPGGPWPGFTSGNGGSTVRATLALVPLLIAEILVLAVIHALRARRGERQGQSVRQSANSKPASEYPEGFKITHLSQPQEA